MFISSLCGAAAWTAEVNIARAREGLGVGARRRRAPAPSQEPTRPRGGLGRAAPSQEQYYVHSGVVRRSRMDG